MDHAAVPSLTQIMADLSSDGPHASRCDSIIEPPSTAATRSHRSLQLISKHLRELFSLLSQAVAEEASRPVHERDQSKLDRCYLMEMCMKRSVIAVMKGLQMEIGQDTHVGERCDREAEGATETMDIDSSACATLDTHQGQVSMCERKEPTEVERVLMKKKEKMEKQKQSKEQLDKEAPLLMARMEELIRAAENGLLSGHLSKALLKSAPSFVISARSIAHRLRGSKCFSQVKHKWYFDPDQLMKQPKVVAPALQQANLVLHSQHSLEADQSMQFNDIKEGHKTTEWEATKMVPISVYSRITSATLVDIHSSAISPKDQPILHKAATIRSISHSQAIPKHTAFDAPYDIDLNRHSSVDRHGVEHDLRADCMTS